MLVAHTVNTCVTVMNAMQHTTSCTMLLRVCSFWLNAMLPAVTRPHGGEERCECNGVSEAERLSKLVLFKFQQTCHNTWHQMAICASFVFWHDHKIVICLFFVIFWPQKSI